MQRPVSRKPGEFAEARRLRAEAVPFRQIAAKIHVSPSSVVAWTRDIELTPEQHAENLRGPRGPLNAERLRLQVRRWSESCRARRIQYQEAGRACARQGDHLHLAGCMLYWAEGTKSRNALVFVNSDPSMVLFFRRFATEALAIPVAKIRMRLNVYTGNGLSLDRIERYWLRLLDLPTTCARKHTVNHLPTSSSGLARSKLPYGVCSLGVHSTEAVQHVFGAIQEYASFDEPTWLG
jgi:hypothetical protein